MISISRFFIVHLSGNSALLYSIFITTIIPNKLLSHSIQLKLSPVGIFKLEYLITDEGLKMNKGYLIAHVTIKDPIAYAEYAKAAGDAMKNFNPKIIAWSGQYENLEGEIHERHVIFEFDSFAEARRFYESPEYQKARAIRSGAAIGTFVLVEGAAL
jgi:uncharacterized protein (DUF1330 family)